MRPEKDPQRPKDKGIKAKRLKRDEAISKLSGFKNSYTVEKFILDLEVYFEGEIDLDLDKIQETVAAPGNLDRLIEKAKEENTHPVIEFIKELFKELAS